VATGRRARDLGGADVPGRAGLVLHNDRLSQRDRETLGKEPSHEIERPARCERVDQPYGLGWVLLRRRVQRNQREGDGGDALHFFSWSAIAFLRSLYSVQGKKQSLSSAPRCSFALATLPTMR